MSLFIYEEYKIQKRKNLKKSVHLTRIEESADEHRAKIALDEILKRIQLGMNDEEEIDIGNIRLIHFMWHLQRRIGNVNKSI